MLLRLFIWLIICAATVVNTSVAMANGLDQNHPDHVRALLIAKLVPYVYWKGTSFQNADSTFNLCVIESKYDSIAQLWPFISLLNARKFEHRTYVVKDISRLQQSPEKLPPDCHIYYFAKVDDMQIRLLVQLARQRKVLTIVDTFEELEKGAMLGLIEERGKMKIYVNTRALGSSDLKIKSTLLNIAKKV